MQTDSKKKWTVPGPAEDDHAHYEYKVFVNNMPLVLAALQPSNVVEIKRMKKVTAEDILQEFAEKLKEHGVVKAEDYIGRKLLHYVAEREISLLTS